MSASNPSAIPSPGRTFPGAASLATACLRRLMRRMAAGHVVIHTPEGEVLEQHAPAPGPHGVMVLHRWRAVRRLLLEGDLGLAESYIAGDWSSPDLAALIELGAVNQAALGDGLNGSLPARFFNRLLHMARANTLRGSRKNIPAHYDLGNDFYAAWLDRGMSYSSALYTAQGQSLEAAQTAKQDRAIALLDPTPGDGVLEIGCGWGGLAERLAAEHDCHVTGLTLSPAQLDYARKRLEGAGLAPLADLRLQDYREAEGRFDRVVSIEMLEAVGVAYWPTFFGRLREALRPGGVAVLQVITIDESRYDSYRQGADFIQRHVFPGGMLPSITVMKQQIAQAGMTLAHMETFGASYARTLAEWGRRFANAWPELHSQGFPEAFRRKWEYYLAYCEAGFRAGTIDVGLYRILRPGEPTGLAP